MMAHSLITHAVAAAPISTSSPPPSLGFQKISVASQQKTTKQSLHHPLRRREVVIGLGLGGAVFGLSGIESGANAAARRPPPPPPKEKKDPNVSGVLAKVIASKKRKEAMKDSIAKLRLQGNLKDSQPQAATPPGGGE